VIRDMTAPCPMGCGRRLHLMEAGVIRCLGKGCPDPMAAQKILEGDTGADLVRIEDGGFSVLHPLRERLGGGLFECQVGKIMSAMDGPPAAPGRYRATIDDDGRLELALIVTEKSATRSA
jgi:hypothetical protein